MDSSIYFIGVGCDIRMHILKRAYTRSLLLRLPSKNIVLEKEFVKKNLFPSRMGSASASLARLSPTYIYLVYIYLKKKRKKKLHSHYFQQMLIINALPRRDRLISIRHFDLSRGAEGGVEGDNVADRSTGSSVRAANDDNVKNDNVIARCVVVITPRSFPPPPPLRRCSHRRAFKAIDLRRPFALHAITVGDPSETDGRSDYDGHFIIATTLV